MVLFLFSSFTNKSLNGQDLKQIREINKLERETGRQPEASAEKFKDKVFSDRQAIFDKLDAEELNRIARSNGYETSAQSQREINHFIRLLTFIGLGD
jgi:hypothetical protein